MTTWEEEKNHIRTEFNYQIKLTNTIQCLKNADIRMLSSVCRRLQNVRPGVSQGWRVAEFTAGGREMVDDRVKLLQLHIPLIPHCFEADVVGGRFEGRQNFYVREVALRQWSPGEVCSAASLWLFSLCSAFPAHLNTFTKDAMNV